MQKRRALALMLLLAASALPLTAAADPGPDPDPVLQVLVVNVAPENLPAYLERVRDMRAVQERLGASGKLRMWKATPNGGTDGNLIVSIEYDDLNSFAENFAKLQADAEWQKILDGLPAIRELLSSGIYSEISP